ncbi:hypothetical protein [Mucilaginibacter gossypii]|uniref:Fibronectin type-III domain-containing protein n=1 Tax=Mucilaginibacter gossypii TaxID=551996 RepID=A0A1G8ADW2_9SPHI|nr:hypothetical protein [Mucilaginibacter gossypii]SDH19063.1 hypothetical protein SAMN05192573_107166 [Mucilaginibacter gossypii]
MKKDFSILALLLILCACGGKKNNEIVPSPSVVKLNAPAQNTICLTGAVVSPTLSSVTFQWNASANTNSYDLVIQNLVTLAVTTNNTTETQLTLNLLRGAPFSWHVVSKSTSTSATAESDQWKFYNSGPGIVTYAPFPAEIISPAYGTTITSNSGKIDLTWKGSSPGNLDLTYDVYLGTSSNPALLKKDITAISLNDVAVTAGTTYYWKITTKDAAGNKSESVVYTFKVK